MKIMQSKIIAFLLPLCGLLSCVQEMKDIVIESSPKLVVECYLNPADEYIRVVVNQSRPILGEGSGSRDSGEPVRTAAVVLASGHQQITIPYHPELHAYSIPTRQFRLVAGRTYMLNVSAKGFTNTTASCTIPRPVSVLTFRDGKLTYVQQDRNLYRVYRKRTLSWVNNQTNQLGYYLVGNGVGNSVRWNA